MFIAWLKKQKNTSVSSDVTTHHMQDKHLQNLSWYNYIKAQKVLRTKMQGL